MLPTDIMQKWSIHINKTNGGEKELQAIRFNVVIPFAWFRENDRGFKGVVPSSPHTTKKRKKKKHTKNSDKLILYCFVNDI